MDKINVSQLIHFQSLCWTKLCLISVRMWQIVYFAKPEDQVSLKKTYKWAMETTGPKSNSSELLCLSSNFDDDLIKNE